MSRTVLSRLALSLLVLPGLAFRAEALAAGPVAPCNGSGDAGISPAYAPMGGPPNFGSWHARDLTNWQPATCLGWYGDTRLAVAEAARFRSAVPVADLAYRLGAVSRFPSIKFWAITRQQWQPLAEDAFVVDWPQSTKVRRPDPPPEALTPGHDYYYAEDTDVSGRAIYRMRVLARTENRLVMATENVTPISLAVFTLFPPNALQIVTFLDRDGDGWAFYAMTRAASDSNSMVASYQSAYLNRLEAMRRVLAGLPTDRDPPIARW